MEQQLSEHKRKFQLDRMIFFSDAIFAIAITLLVLEIKIPELPKEKVTNALINQSLEELIPKIAGFFISFCIIGLYWFKHHSLFGYVTDYDNRLILMNFLFLFTIVTMPFTTGFYSTYIMHPQKTPFMLYIANIVASGFMLVTILLYIKNPKRKLSSGLENKLYYQYFLMRAILIPVMFSLIAIIYLLSPAFAVYEPLIIPLVFLPFTLYYKKKLSAAKTKLT